MAPPRTSCTSQLRRTLAFGSLFLGLAASASAQGTDACTTPTVLGNAFGTFAIDNTAAAVGEDASSGCGSMNRDVWFTWNAPVSGSVVVATCGGISFDSLVGVYAGTSCPGGASLGCSDDGCSLQSSASFTAVSGTDYVIQIGGFSAGSGVGTFTISGPPVPPANDSCATPTAVAGFGSFAVSSAAAAAGNDAVPGCATIGRDVWYVWTAPSSGTTVVSTCGGMPNDTVVAVWDGAVCPTTVVGCSDDACGAQSSVSFAAVATQSYMIQVGSFGGGGGAAGTFSISGPPVPPVNDDCTAATAIAGAGTFPFTVVNATTGTQGQAEAICNFFATTAIDSDVWYAWTAPSTGIATVSTCTATSVDTKIAAYSGAACPSAAAIACSDDNCSLQTTIQFACQSGSVYMLQVGTYPAASQGAGNFNITVGAPTVKLSQIYGAGGNTWAPLFNDFIEIHNPGPVPQPLGGWSVQYASAAGAFTAGGTVALPAVTLGVGRYLLVNQGTGGTLLAGQVPVNPTGDATGTVAMAATGTKVALVSSTTPIPTALGQATYAGVPTLVDFVGEGTTANWNDASAAGAVHTTANNAPPMSTVYSIYRNNCGVDDTNVSRADWSNGTVAPRNTATAANAGLTLIGSALPLTLKSGDSVRLTATPFRCATNDLLAGTTVTANLTAIGGAAAASLFDDGTGGDEVASDGLYTLVTTATAATGTYSLPLTATNGANSGGSYISIFVTPAAAPANDNCYSAIPVGSLPASLAGTVVGATVESNPTGSGTSLSTFPAQGARRGVWYSVVGDGNTLTASLCGTLPVFDSVMNVYTGTCDGLTLLGWNDDFCASLNASQVTWCSQAGATYFVWIAPFSTAAPTNTFTLNVTSGAACATALPATICLGTAGPFTEVEPGYGVATNDGCGSTPNRFTDIAMPSPSGSLLRGTARGHLSNRDIDAYRFLATASGPIQITIDTLGTNAQAQLVSLAAGGVCPQSAIIVSTPTFVARCVTAIQTVSSNVVAGTWYSINVVGGLSIDAQVPQIIFGGQMPGGTTYQYRMTVSVGAPPANDLCAGATTLTGVSVAGNTLTATNDGTSTCDATGDDVWYTFTAGVNAGTLSLNTCGATVDTVISVYGGCPGNLLNELACNDDCGGSPCAGPGSCTSVPVGAGATVKIRVSDKGGAGGAFTMNWSFAVPPPANDECVGATVISGNGPFAYDNQFATPTTATAPGSVCQASQSKDIWYAWTSTGAGTVNVDTCGGPTWDSVITIYTGACGSLTEIACDDDTCVTPAFGSQLSFTAACTTTYYIRISSFGTSVGAVGSFNLTAPGNTDTDGDTVPDCTDGCPLDPLKIAPGICGCGVSDVDTDGDTVADCLDGCPLDPLKTAPGICGCGVSDVDTDGDTVADCLDGCPLDPAKTAPGICGCGVSDVDSDGDTVADCIDGCPTDPLKTAPGICGCNVSDVDSDGDTVADCIDGCPTDPLKTAPGICGCNVSDVDSDGDTVADCLDGCPTDPLKTAPGVCGCGVADTDSDGDSVADCVDGCPADPLKTAPGQCGCGVVDVDGDGDSVADCIDNCDTVANAGQADLDGDAVGDACDNCANVSNPAQGDCNGDLIGDACEIFYGVPDCNLNGIPDTCDIANATSADLNANSIPDECETNGGTPYCFGYTGCPCGNNSLPGSGQGCMNSTGQGAMLLGSGLSSLGADGLVLTVTNLPVPGSGTGFALFFQGDAATNAVFQDGRRCVSGSQVRLATKAHTGGTTSYPQGGDNPVSVEGFVGGPGARYYQVWYRNVIGPCGTGSNVSNGLSVIWVP